MPFFPATASYPVVYDFDAVSYFNRALISDSTAKSRISSFIASAKADGTWDLMDDGWLLIDTQNAGGGLTAHALKSSANNGVIVNSPAWSSSGITFTGASSQKITTSFAPTGTAMSVFLTHATTADSAVCGQDDQGSNRRFEILTSISFTNENAVVFNPTSHQPVIGGYVNGTRHSLMLRAGASKLALYNYVDAEQTDTAGAVTNTGAGLVIGGIAGAAGTVYMTGTLSHLFYFSSVLSDALRDSFYANIKATIGASLGLP